MPGTGPAMPKAKEELPSTIERSPERVRRAYEEALESAHEQYDSEERAHRTAWSAVKHIAEKKGDRWHLKDEPGPSDPQAKQSGRAARERPKKTAGGIDVESSTRDELYERAKELSIEGRSKMNKRELAEAVRRKA
jgi:cation transport regulator ChaB